MIAQQPRANVRWCSIGIGSNTGCASAETPARAFSIAASASYSSPLGARFAFIRWQANGFGTVVSRVDILRACGTREPCATVPGVRPRGEILLRLSGWDRVQRVLEVIDAVE